MNETEGKTIGTSQNKREKNNWKKRVLVTCIKTSRYLILVYLESTKKEGAKK